MTSHRRVFRSTAIFGGSSVVSMIISIAKVKALALMLGPAGIGLMGLYLNLLGVAAKIAAAGMDSSGVRQVATYASDRQLLSAVRRALWLSNLVHGTAGMIILWSLREPIGNWVFGGNAHGTEVAWLGLGLLLTLIAGSQTALLQGLRQVKELALVNIASALIAACIGILAVYFLGKDGVLWFVLSAPAMSFLVTRYFVSRIPELPDCNDLAMIRQQWRLMLELGIPLMAAGLITLLTQLSVRSIVLHEFGLEASGYLQAVWAISVTYVGIVLNAMVIDYYPRLTTAIHNHENAGKLVNEQAEMALLFFGPALMLIVTLTPWLIELLYSEGFGPAAEILRWQVLGDIFRVASVPIVFIFLAKGKGGIAIGIQLVWSLSYLGSLSFGLGHFGLVMAGISFAIAYIGYYIVVAAIAYRLIGFKLTRRNWAFTFLLSLSAISVALLTLQSNIVGLLIGSLATLLVSAYSFRRLEQLTNVIGWLRQRFLSGR